MEDLNLDIEWINLIAKLEDRFGEDLELETILFLIGVQELGKGHQLFSKDQKMDLMHIAICKLLEPYGHYKYKGVDDDGWPHWERLNKLPHLSAQDQTTLMKSAIVQYFKSEE